MNQKLKLLAGRQAGVFSRRQALASGYTAKQIRQRLDDGRWARIRHGQYAVPLDLTAAEPWVRLRENHRRLVHAVVNSRRHIPIAVTHQSALSLHGLPLWGLDLEHVHVTGLDDSVSGVVAGVHHHTGGLVNADLTEVDGLVSTTVARAAFETACTTCFDAAVVTFDAARHGHLVPDDELVRLLALTEYWPGSATARSAWTFSDARSESVGESRLRILMHNHGLPAPVLQAEFDDADGFVARVDFYFERFATVVEFDGRSKYADAVGETLRQEKVREDRLRALGLQVVRSDWSDFNRPDRLIAAIRQAFHRAHRAA